MAEQLVALGSRRLRDGLRIGERAIDIFRDLMKDFGTESFACFVGAISAGLGLIDVAQAKGWKFNCNGSSIGNPAAIAIQIQRAVTQRDLLLLCDYVKLVSSSLDAMQGKIDWSLSANVDKPSQQPIPIAIVSMPTRESSLELTRDENLEIVTTRTVERDIADPQPEPAC